MQSGCLVAMWVTNRERHRRFIDTGKLDALAVLLHSRWAWQMADAKQLRPCHWIGRPINQLHGCLPPPGPSTGCIPLHCSLPPPVPATCCTAALLSAAAGPSNLLHCCLPVGVPCRAAAGLGPAPPGHLALAEDHRCRAAGQPAGEQLIMDCDESGACLFSLPGDY